MMNASLEKIFAASYLKPALRTKIGKYDVYIADGMVPEEQIDNFNNAFPITLTEPGYVTFWLAEVGPGRLFGGAAGFDKYHDLTSISLGDRQAARIKSALAFAERDLKKIKVH